MQTIRHVLCPVDLSAASARALRHAVALGSIVDGDLTILHVRAPSGHADSSSSSDTNLEAFASEVIALAPATRLLERRGEAAAEILTTAAAIAPDVIVMGTHGRTGLQRLLVGSVTERVIRRSPVPVLVVPPCRGSEQDEPVRLNTILCAVDFSEPSARAIDYAASIAAAAGARLLLAHALEWSEEVETLPNTRGAPLPSSEEDALARMNELLTTDIRTRCAPELLVGYGAPAEEVMRFVEERHADVVVVGIRERNAIGIAVFGSTTQRLIRGGRCVVLTVRAPSEVHDSTDLFAIGGRR